MGKASKTTVLSLGVMCIAVSLMLVESAHSQSPARNFPAGKTITMIVPWPAGGSTDVTARYLASALEKELSTSIQIVNKAGAASQVGMTALINSKPDGYTLGFASLPTLITHYLDPGRDAPYSLKSFQPVAQQWQAPFVLAVAGKSPYKTLKDLVEAARANPEKILIGDPGLLGTPHLTVIMMERAAGVKFTSVHFAGGAPAVTALLGGHVNAAVVGLGDAATQFKSGELRSPGVAGNRESEFLPGVPTMRSLGYDVVSVNSGGVVAPAATPKDIVEIVTRAIKKIVESDAHKKDLATVGASSSYLSPEQYTALWMDYENRFGPVLKAVRASQPKSK